MNTKLYYQYSQVNSVSGINFDTLKIFWGRWGLNTHAFKHQPELRNWTQNEKNQYERSF